MTIELDPGDILSGLLEAIDEDHADPDGDGTTPTAAMKEAAEIFSHVVAMEYESWACEPTGEKVTVSTTDARSSEP